MISGCTPPACCIHQAIRPDCVIDMPDRTGLDEVCDLLAAGINIVTARADFFNPAIMEAAVRERVEALCRAGSASIHATGSSPGFHSRGGGRPPWHRTHNRVAR